VLCKISRKKLFSFSSLFFISPILRSDISICYHIIIKAIKVFLSWVSQSSLREVNWGKNLKMEILKFNMSNCLFSWTPAFSPKSELLSTRPSPLSASDRITRVRCQIHCNEVSAVPFLQLELKWEIWVARARVSWSQLVEEEESMPFLTNCILQNPENCWETFAWANN